MLSYIVGILAIGVFLANPINNFFFPPKYRGSADRLDLTPKPPLNESLLALVGPNDSSLECPPDAYAARILRTDPLVVYLENFLSEQERSHLLDIRYDSQVPE